MANSNISVVHATDFGSSLWKSRSVATSKKPLSDNAAHYEYPFIRLAVFTRGYTAVEDRVRNWDVSILIILLYVSSQGLIFALNARLSFFSFWLIFLRRCFLESSHSRNSFEFLSFPETANFKRRWYLSDKELDELYVKRSSVEINGFAMTVIHAETIASQWE